MSTLTSFWASFPGITLADSSSFISVAGTLVFDVTVLAGPSQGGRTDSPNQASRVCFAEAATNIFPGPDSSEGESLTMLNDGDKESDLTPPLLVHLGN